MAEQVDFQGADVKIRNPWGVWLLGIITLGIYHLVWWYKINRELRDYSAAAGRPLGNDPTASLLAVFPGGIVIVPAIWTIVTTSSRVRQVREMVDGAPSSDPNGLLAVVLGLIAGLQTVYIGYAINSCWRGARERAGQGALPALLGGSTPPAPPAESVAS
jgi:Domain of unknown function (DUF4234)